MKYTTVFILFSFLFLSISCGSNDPTDPGNCSTQFSQSFEDELTAVNVATQNYAADPSSENCQAFKDAYNDYLDALDDWEECANFYNQVTQWEQAIESARMSVDSIIC